MKKLLAWGVAGVRGAHDAGAMRSLVENLRDRLSAVSRALVDAGATNMETGAVDAIRQIASQRDEALDAAKRRLAEVNRCHEDIRRYKQQHSEDARAEIRARHWAFIAQRHADEHEELLRLALSIGLEACEAERRARAAAEAERDIAKAFHDVAVAERNRSEHQLFQALRERDAMAEKLRTT